MQQRPLLGFSLALFATMTWGSLPIAVKQVIHVIDATTLVWVRFVFAMLGWMLMLRLSHHLPKRSQFSWRNIKLLLLGVIGISGNFLLGAESLHYISPTTMQVLWQLAPFGMIMAGLFIFKEPFSFYQKIGLLCLVLGLGLFFNDKFSEMFSLGHYALGILLCAGGSIIWVCYGIAQKLLSEKFSPQQILMLIYFSCAIIFIPFVKPTSVGNLDSPFLWICFIYCCLNTVIGYGTYGEALNHWDASKISIVTTLIPIFTMIFSLIGHAISPNLFADPDMNRLSYFGAVIVVCGAVLAAMGDKLFQKQNK